MVVRFLDVKAVSRDRLALWEGWLAAEKRQRIDRLPEQNRLNSLCADGLVREMLGEYLGCVPEEVVFTYAETGKPLTAGACFSVSHSDTLVGRAWAGEWQSEVDFWQRWTCREAAIKCRGERLGAWKRDREEGLTFFPLAAPDGFVAALCEEKE